MKTRQLFLTYDWVSRILRQLILQKKVLMAVIHGMTIVGNGVVPPNNIGPRSIEGGAGLNTTYSNLVQ